MDNAVYPRRKRQVWYWVFLVPALIAFLLFKWLPLLGSLLMSFLNWNLLTPAKFIGLANYKNILLLDPLFWKYLRNSLFLSTFTVLIAVPFSLFITILLVEIGRGKGLLRKLFLVPLVSSAVGLSLIWRWMYNPDFGLINYLLSLIGIKGPPWLASTAWAKPALILMNSWYFLGLGMLVYLAGLKGIGKETYEQMQSRGLSFWGRTYHVYLPHLKGCILLVSLFLFAAFFSQSSGQYIMTGGGPAGATTNLGYYIYSNTYQWFKMGYGSALSVIVIVFMVILAVLALKVISKSHLGLRLSEKREIFPSGVEKLKTVSRSKFAWGMVTFLLALVALSQALPLIWAFLTSLKEPGQVFAYPLQFIPRPLTLKNYAEAWSGVPFLRFFANSLFVSSVTTVAVVSISFLAAYSLAVIRGPFHRGFCLAILLTLFLPLSLLAMPLFAALRFAGLLDSYTALILPYLAWPFGFLIFLLFLERFPEDRLSQAREKGWNDGRILREIILPRSKPVLFLGAVVAFLSSWNSFFWPLVCTNSMEKKTLSIGLASFQGLHSSKWSLLMAGGCLAIFLLIILFLSIERYIFSPLSLPNFFPPLKERKRFIRKVGVSVTLILIALMVILHPSRLRDAKYKQGLMMMNRKQYQRAIDYFQKKVKESPDPRMIFQMGRGYEKLGDTAKAREAYRKIISNYPNSNLTQQAESRIKTLRLKK